MNSTVFIVITYQTETVSALLNFYYSNSPWTKNHAVFILAGLAICLMDQFDLKCPSVLIGPQPVLADSMCEQSQAVQGLKGSSWFCAVLTQWKSL